MKEKLIIVYNLFRLPIIVVFRIIIGIICKLIYLFTYEKNTKNKVTKRKFKRIKTLTNFKIWMWDNFPHLFIFLEEGRYMKKLKERYS